LRPRPALRHRDPRPLVRGRERLRPGLGPDHRRDRRDHRPRAPGIRGGPAVTAQGAHRDLSALETATALRSGDLDAIEHTEGALAAARGPGARVGALAHLLEDLSLRQAETAARVLEQARRSGALDQRAAERPVLGMLLPIKDLPQIAQQPFKAGSRTLRGVIAEVTDGVAQLLIDAGTVTLGKTTTPEFGMPCYTEPATGAPARTPWDLRR